jgi:two-component system sensor histidine kinase BarA
MKFAENKAVNLLLIEDNNEQALIIKLILENNNCKVKIINEGQKALDYIKSQKDLPELIFLDYYLPDMTGIDLLKQIAHYNSGIVFLTAINDTEIALEAIRLGAIDFITKSEHLAEALPIALQKAYKIYI